MSFHHNSFFTNVPTTFLIIFINYKKIEKKYKKFQENCVLNAISLTTILQFLTLFLIIFMLMNLWRLKYQERKRTLIEQTTFFFFFFLIMSTIKLRNLSFCSLVFFSLDQISPKNTYWPPSFYVQKEQKIKPSQPHFYCQYYTKILRINLVHVAIFVYGCKLDTYMQKMHPYTLFLYVSHHTRKWMLTLIVLLQEKSIEW